MEQLLAKLANAKKIMDVTEGIKRGEVRQINSPQAMVENFDIPQAKYNIPKEFLSESSTPSEPYLSSVPRENTKPVGTPSIDAIKKSKLPEEIKRLMMEHPINQPNTSMGGGTVLSDELVERATRLMKKEDENYLPEAARQPKQQTTQPSVGIDYKLIQKMINEAVENALRSNGLLTESTEKTNESFSFKVGKHIFEGKVTKVKKLS